MLQPAINFDKKYNKPKWRKNFFKPNSSLKGPLNLNSSPVSVSNISSSDSISPTSSSSSANQDRLFKTKSVCSNSSLSNLLTPLENVSGNGHLSYFTPFTDFDSIFNGSLSKSSESCGPKSKSVQIGDVHNSSISLHDVISSPKRRGPKVKPFIFTQSQQPNSRSNSINELKCFICDEFLKTKLQHEKLIELRCGDFIHGECFKISIEFEIEKLVNLNLIKLQSSKTILIDQIFPQCNGENCSHGDDINKMLPVDNSLIDDIITNALINQKEKISIERGSNIILLSSTLKTPVSASNVFDTPRKSLTNSFSESSTDALNTSFNEFSNYSSISNCCSFNASSETCHSGTVSPLAGTLGMKSPRTPPPPPPPPHSPPPLRHFANYSFRSSNSTIRQSSLSSLKSSRSPSPAASLSTMNTVTVKIPNYKNISIDKLKNHFIKYLIDNCKNLNLTNLLKLGELRLVDNLLISYDGANYELKIVYLFQNYLIIWNLNSIDNVLFPLNNIKIQTPSPSILKILNRNFNPPELWLNSEIGSIIEKWVVATSDFNFNFPNEILTSTIVLPEFSNSSNSRAPPRHVLSSTSSKRNNKLRDSTLNLINENLSETPVLLRSVENLYIESNSIAENGDQLLYQINQDKHLLVDNHKIDDLFKISDRDENSLINCYSNKNDDEVANDNFGGKLGNGFDDYNNNLTDDSDEDSDQELINDLIKKSKGSENISRWSDLLTKIDDALINSKICS